MVGDSLRADVAGAKALGMIAVWKRPPWARPDADAGSKPPNWGGATVSAQSAAEDATLPDGTVAVPDYVIDHPRELLDLPIFQDDEYIGRQN